jgi:hypothetical protein
MGVAYSPTQRLSKTARMPIKLVQCWRNSEEDIQDMLRIQKDIRTQLEAFGGQINSLGEAHIKCGVSQR